MKVLDAVGDELRIGDRVERWFGPELQGGLLGEVVGCFERRVYVAFPGTGRVAQFSLRRRCPFSRTFICSDLRVTAMARAEAAGWDPLFHYREEVSPDCKDGEEGSASETFVYDGVFPLDWLRPGERVAKARRAGSACVIFDADDRRLLVEPGDELTRTPSGQARVKRAVPIIPAPDETGDE